MEAQRTATLSLPERLRLMPPTLRDEMQLLEEKAFRDHNHLQDLEAGQREDSVVAPVATAQVVQEVFMERKTRKSLPRGVLLVFALWM